MFKNLIHLVTWPCEKVDCTKSRQNFHHEEDNFGDEKQVALLKVHKVLLLRQLYKPAGHVHQAGEEQVQPSQALGEDHLYDVMHVLDRKVSK